MNLFPQGPAEEVLPVPVDALKNQGDGHWKSEKKGEA
jgi:hypothetical protein